MTITIPSDFKGGTLCIRLAGAASAAAGGLGYLLNPFGQTVIITRATLYIDTPSTGAANLDVGVASAGATDATDIINALAVNGAITGKAYNGFAMQNTGVTEITAPALWHSTDYVTFTGSASTADLVATLYLECLPI